MNRLTGKLTALLLVVLVFFMLPAMADENGTLEALSKASGTLGDNLTWVLDGNGTLTISGTGDMPDMDEYAASVRSCPWGNDFTRVVIESGVTSIGNYAFWDCSDLTSVTMPEGLTRIGQGALLSSKIHGIQLPDSVTSIGPDNFNSSQNYNDAQMAIVNHGTAAEKACCEAALYFMLSGAEDLILFGGIDSVTGENRIVVEEYVGSAAVVKVPEGVTSIGSSAFSSCRSLVSVTLPETLLSIGNQAFYGCSSLTSVTMQGKLTSIGDAAFYACISLPAVTLPESVTSIGSSVFYDCRSLDSVRLPDGVISIGSNSFEKIRPAIVKPGSSAETTCCQIGTYFIQAGNDDFVIRGTLDSTTGEKKLDVVKYIGTATEVTVPSGVISVSGAFEGCGTLTSVTLPEGLTTIGYYAFKDCSSLSTVVLPESLTVILGNAFQNCSSLTEITLPENVQTIDDYVFYGCNNLTSVCLPDGLTSVDDGNFSTRLRIAVINPGTSAEAACYQRGTYFTLSNHADYLMYGCLDSETEARRLEVIEYSGNAAEVTIPEEVTSLGNGAFADGSSVKALKLPEGLISIGDYALNGCTSLTSVQIPDGVIEIGSDNFNAGFIAIVNPGTAAETACYQCGTYFSMPGYEDYVLYGSIDGDIGARNLKVVQYAGNADKVVIPDGITSIGSDVFNGNTTLMEITLPDSLTSIGHAAFMGCENLESIELPEGITVLSGNLFYSCKGLKTVTLPKNLTSIEYNAFYSCTALQSLQLPDGLKSIGNEAFLNCTSLTSLSVPESVKSIGRSAFAYCMGLTTLTLPESVESIDSYMLFRACSSLKTIKLPKGMTSIGSSAFAFCTSLSSVTIPDCVTRIDSNAFEECTSLSGVRLPDGVTTLGYSNFNALRPAIVTPGSVTEETCLKGGNYITWPGSEEYILYGSLDSTTGKRSIQLARYKGEDTEANVPADVTGIGVSAFYGNSNLLKVNIPEGVKIIESSAFQNCSKLAEVSLPLSLERIDSYAFDNCSSLKTLAVPEGVKNIGSGAFRNCSSLTTFVVPLDVTSLGDNMFSGCTSLNGVTLPSSLTAIGSKVFCNCTSLARITLPETLTTIGNQAFENCQKLNDIVFPEKLKTIGSGAFQYCDSLDSVFIPDSVETIGTDAFHRSASELCVIYCNELTYTESWATLAGHPVVLMDAADADLTPTITLPDSVQLMKNASQQIYATIIPRLPGQSITYTSNAPDVVYVDAQGTMTGVSAGSATITVTVDQVSASMEVRVVVPVQELVMPEIIWIVGKTTRDIPVTIVPAGAACDLVFATDNAVYASIDENGMLYGGAVGSTGITVTDQLTGISATSTVRITYRVTAVSFTEESCTMRQYETKQMTANVTMKTESCVNELVTFSSSDERVAVVDQHGMLSAKAAGTTTITATAANGVSGSCVVTVRALKRSVLPAGLLVIEEEALMGTAAECYVLPDGVTSIGSKAFADCTSLICVEIPASVTSIETDAFAGCKGLTIVAPERSEAHNFAVDAGFLWKAK